MQSNAQLSNGVQHMSYILGRWGAAIVLEHQSMYCRPYGAFVDHLDAAAGGK